MLYHVFLAAGREEVHMQYALECFYMGQLGLLVAPSP
jgi:hypothetical protein